MADIAFCAICGEEKELCESVRINKIKQPRVCKECLLNEINTGEWDVKDTYWILQMQQLNDQESLNELQKL